MSAPSFISFSGVSKSYDGAHYVVEDLNLDVRKGEFLSLLGPSGSGKTTTLMMLAGFETPTQGEIRLDGRRLDDKPPHQRDIGMVFQNYALFPHLTIAENVAFPLSVRRVSRAEQKTRVKRALEMIELPHLASRRPSQLSGGQQQRVALARSLVYQPAVILLDEPLSNLDAKLREEARIWLRTLIKEKNLSALCVTHDQVEALALADRVTLLSGGRIVQVGSPQELYGHPRTLLAAEFMGQNNRLPGRLVGRGGQWGEFEAKNLRLRGLLRGPPEFPREVVGLIRVEAINVVDGPGDNRIQIPLLTSMYLGDRWEHLFRDGDLTLRVHSAKALSDGQHWLELPPESFWLF